MPTIRPRLAFIPTALTSFMAAIALVVWNASPAAPESPVHTDSSNGLAVLESRVEFARNNAVLQRLSQYGQLTGVVTDSSTGRPIENVEIRLSRPDSSRTGFGAITQVNGRFWITKIPPAAYAISIRHARYTKQNSTHVEVESDSTVLMNVALAQRQD